MGLTLLSALPGWSQTITIDGTTPTTQLNGGATCTGNCTITGGTAAGGNLFHSFTRFGVDPGATVTFTDPGVQNIITRVTGNTLSVIDGLLAVNGGNANLFLLNPNGITFGDGARLQLGGSFFASTASGIAFDEGEFSLTDSSATTSLLAVNVPIGLQVGANAGNIMVNGTGNNLFVNPNFSIVDSLITPDLQLNQGTLALVGGAVTLDGAVLSAPGNRIEVGSVSNGQVGLVPLGTGFGLSYGGVDTFSNISLENAALIDVSADRAGTISLRGQTVTLNGGSALTAGTLGNSPGGSVQVNADRLLVSGTSTFVPSFIPPSAAELVVMPSGVFAGVQTGAGGTGGQIDLNVGQLSLDGGAQIAAGTFSSGNAGALNVAANSITVRGGRPAGPSGIFATVGAAADGGPIGAATGNGGTLNIATDVLLLQEGGQISAGTFGFGDAGNLNITGNRNINSTLIEVTGSFGEPGTGGPSSIRAASERPWAGAGGNLTINTERLLVNDGGQIVTGTLSASDAGDLVVRATQIELRGGDAFGQSGLLSNAIDFQASGLDGSSGNIMVETNDLRLDDGATISVSNTPSGGNPNLTSGQGPAGNITIAARNILMTNGSSLSADTLNGDRANIQVAATNLTLLNSRISTNATGTATGGNITLDTGALTLLDTSTVAANSAANFGGRVIIHTDVLVQSPDSTITATSALGPEFSGVVNINTPEPVPETVPVQTESPSETKQIIAACEQLTDNEFVATGQGGLPNDPTQVLRSQSTWTDIRPLTAESLTELTPQSENPTPTSDSVAALSQAQGLTRNDQGQLVLVGSSTGPTTASAIAHQTSLCHRAG
ncbi:MAG: filamentous hemagglutinin N-terminal domain-containing protein [Leptolyngbya sp. SIOISBB]|nr:filamentous hemagglutinin N-terminal domain-containing protein [Leptolyngbya sp. SIOISBB]